MKLDIKLHSTIRFIPIFSKGSWEYIVNDKKIKVNKWFTLYWLFFCVEYERAYEKAN